jgi:hypothetical protein
MLLKIAASVLATIGSLVAGGASLGCVFLFFEEAETPASLIER